MSTSWKKDLPHHSIFQHKPTKPTHNCDLLAIHGSEIFIACDSIVRYADVARSADYVELDVPGADFPIIALKLNRSRSLLMISGQDKVVAVFIPRGSSLTKRSLKSHVVGELNHRDTQVQQVSVHPNCSADSSVLILTADAYLRLYDFNLSFEEAETTIDLLPSQVRESLSRHHIGDTAEVDASSFCFGSGGDGWTAYTVFVLMRNGDVYSVCPLVPSNCHATLKEINNFDAYARREPGTQAAAAFIRISQAIENGTRSTLGVSFVRPVRLQPPSVCGPLLFCPAPLEFASHDVQMTSICFLPSQPINVLAIASDGKVDVCTVSDPIQPGNSGSLEINVHESITLPGIKEINLKNHGTDTALYVMHNNGLHEVEMKLWLKDLADAFASESDERLRDSASEGISSLVTVMLDSALSPLIGCDRLEDDLETSLVLIRASFDVHVIPVGQELTVEGLGEKPVSDIEMETTTESAAEIPQYLSLLESPSYKPRQLPRRPQIVIPHNISHKNLKADVETLRFLVHFATQMRKDMENLMNSFIEMHRRFQLQQKEYQRQTEKVEALTKLVETLEGEDSSRLEAALRRQAGLEKKCARLVQSLMHNDAPKLSDAEKRYLEELNRIEKHALAPKGLLSRIISAKAQLAKVQESLPTLEHDTADKGIRDSPLRTTQISRLRSQIDCNEEVLRKSRARLEHVSKTHLGTV